MMSEENELNPAIKAAITELAEDILNKVPSVRLMVSSMNDDEAKQFLNDLAGKTYPYGFKPYEYTKYAPYINELFTATDITREERIKIMYGQINGPVKISDAEIKIDYPTGGEIVHDMIKDTAELLQKRCDDQIMNEIREILKDEGVMDNGKKEEE